MKRNQQKSSGIAIRLVGWGLPAAAAVTGLAGEMAVAAPGDLDPSFGDVGRVVVATPGVASFWSLDLQDDGSVFFGGGGEYDYYDYTYIDEFVGHLSPEGKPDPNFAPASLRPAAVYDTAVQPDGKVVGTGVAYQPVGQRKLLIFRMLPSGALDASFGLNGTVIISDGTSSRESGHSVTVDPAGNIVVAGVRNQNLLVARVTADGARDSRFGAEGVLVGPESDPYRLHLANAPAGGYRLIGSFLTGGRWDCKVMGLTAVGAIDSAFGSSGYASPPADPYSEYTCAALAVQPDGGIVVGGQDGGEAFVGRLTSSGVRDATFDAGTVPSLLSSVSALGLGATGKVIVAGFQRVGGPEVQVVRLLADGNVDTQYGTAGATRVDPSVRRGYWFALNELKVGRNDSVILGGNAYTWAGSDGFVARLLGDNEGGGPGVFSFVQRRVIATEAGAQAVLSVRRSGGSTGAVAVTYATYGFPWTSPRGETFSPGLPAAAVDYTAATGRLAWGDGDSTEREIVVPIIQDGETERPEWFEVVLEAPEGGAGLGLHGADVEIAGSSYPHGDLSITADTSTVQEGGRALFHVARDYYASGAVSVTVRVAAGGTATSGEDFRNSNDKWQDVVLTWGHGDATSKIVYVDAVADGQAETVESFTLELVSPTGGALLGSQTQAAVQIFGDAAPPPPAVPRKSRSGGGSFGWLGAMLLGLGCASRRLRKQHGGASNA